jgi:tetratricopeptide (TPR) repeat protein
MMPARPKRDDDAAREQVRSCQENVKREPSSGQAYATLAEALIRAEDLEAAARAAESALELDPRLAVPHVVLGRRFMENEQFDEAESQLEQAIILDPHLAVAYTEFGRLHAKQQRYADAVDRFEQAVKLAPHKSDTHLNLASAYMEEGRFRDSGRQVLEALRQNPGDVGAYRLLAWIPFAAFARRSTPIRLLILIALFVPLLAPRPIRAAYWAVITLYCFWINLMAFKYSKRFVASLWIVVTAMWLLLAPWVLCTS